MCLSKENNIIFKRAYMVNVGSGSYSAGLIMPNGTGNSIPVLYAEVL